ncbi:hypothetical protein H4S14_003512 [Agrobacterium vitis]|nr:hypothetical protein [Agrobacterium vitis]MBE1439747.1 hypothetical protein [Agrobacterium vitis]
MVHSHPIASRMRVTAFARASDRKPVPTFRSDAVGRDTLVVARFQHTIWRTALERLSGV